METLTSSDGRRVPWNKGRLTGQKPPLKLREIWAIRTRLQMSSNVRELALFNLAIDSKLRACDLTRLQVQDICIGSHVVSRATFMRQKNATTSAVRNHGANSAERGSMDIVARTDGRRLSVPKPVACVSARVDTPVRSHRSSLGRFDWTG
jgi:hypothetical protein